MTHAQLVKKLEQMAAEAGSQRALAVKLGIGDSYLSEIIGGTRQPGEKVLEALGLERDTRYKLKEQEA